MVQEGLLAHRNELKIAKMVQEGLLTHRNEEM